MIYPAPALVLGVGRFGLAVAEALGEDWYWLDRCGGDPSLRNLRLLHVSPGGAGDADARWRRTERQPREIALHVGDGDLPSLVLDFVVLRTLGLVRFRDGFYQVAVPRDAGVVETAPTHQPDEPHVARRRYFAWRSLGPDPVQAAERLKFRQSNDPELDLFVTPILQQVRQGHSPRILLACVARRRALAGGRDPTPWTGSPGPVTDADHLLDGVLPTLAPPPDIDAWLDANRPAPFDPVEAGLGCAVDPLALLSVDWEAAGWANTILGLDEAAAYTPVQASRYRLGLFDADTTGKLTGEAGSAARVRFSARLQVLGGLLDRGLVRVWVDIQRARLMESAGLPGRRAEAAREATRQSLELLGELLVRPLVDAGVEPVEPAVGDADADRAAREPVLPDAPSERLAGLRAEPMESEDRQSDLARRLDRRLLELGLPAPGRDEVDTAGRAPVFRGVRLEPDDVLGVSPEDPPPGDAVGRFAEGEADRPSVLALKAALNEVVRQLFDFRHLKSYRQSPTRRPARLTVFVVADMGEPFARAALRLCVREVHAELMRAFGPIFDSFREGFDRALSVVPILWMPHPADAHGGDMPVQNRTEEAAIIESVHGLRRWIESVPRGKRCVSQVFVNARVTDNAVVPTPDAVRQTRDFVTLHVRNALDRDPWLRRIAVGPPGHDVFASFACYGIEFPAHRAREYLANRLARGVLRLVEDGDPGRTHEEPTLDGDALVPTPPREAAKAALANLSEITSGDARTLADRVRSRVDLSESTEREVLEGAFDDAFEASLEAAVVDRWRALTREGGGMEGDVDALRRAATARTEGVIPALAKAADAQVAALAGAGGLTMVQAALETQRARARDALEEQERTRRSHEQRCLKHRVPALGPVGTARAVVLAAAAQKPAREPMVAALGMWAVMALAMGAPLSFGLATALGLHRDSGVLEVLLGLLAPLTGALLLTAPAAWALRRHLRRQTLAVVDAVEGMAETVHGVVHGPPGDLMGARPSIRSFFASRLLYGAALSARRFADAVHGHALGDARRAFRLTRSVEVQRDILERRAEALGVRPTPVGARLGAAAPESHDDLRHLFDTAGGHSDTLIDPADLHAVYARFVQDDADLGRLLPGYVTAVGGFAGWRTAASLADTEALLAEGRTRFAAVVERPLAAEGWAMATVGERLCAFVARHYPNIGFGARFRGYEGLDPDGIDVPADAALVLDAGNHTLFEKARARPGAPPSTETLDLLRVGVRPDAAYMLSLAQGIRTHSLRNLARFESFHDRVHLPDEGIFPLSGEAPTDGVAARPIGSVPEPRQRPGELRGTPPDRGVPNVPALDGAPADDAPTPDER